MQFRFGSVAFISGVCVQPWLAGREMFKFKSFFQPAHRHRKMHPANRNEKERKNETGGHDEE
jgi:hypothetical protein